MALVESTAGHDENSVHEYNGLMHPGISFVGSAKFGSDSSVESLEELSHCVIREKILLCAPCLPFLYRYQ